MTPLKIVTTPRSNYRHQCSTCGAVMVATYPGDLILAADRNGWADNQCRTCRRPA